jgi:phenol hydroxylase P1 protein
MSVHISTKVIKQKRVNFGYTERRVGDKKPATRYQEAVYDIQPTTNFHYPPTWEEGKELYDVTRTAIVMEDWYAFTDPRQYYYTSYVTARAKQQENMDNSFKMAEKGGLLDTVDNDLQQSVKQLLTPLRHVCYGANMNNQDICDRGYGTSITSLVSFHGFDHMGMSQYLSRLALLIDENEDTGLKQAKTDWIEGDAWQELRHAMEDIFVLDDWFEIMVAQNVVMDGLIFPLIFDRYINRVASQGGSAFILLTQFMKEWYAETVRWTNQLMKVTAAESDANAELLSQWTDKWTERLEGALQPVAVMAFNGEGSAQLAEVKQELLARLAKQGVKV